MLNPTAITFIAISALEIAVIIIGNVFTISIFWTLRFHLKRTCFLLINLAVADLLVGIAEGAALVIHKSLRTEMQPKGSQSPSWAFRMFASCTPLMSRKRLLLFIVLDAISVLSFVSRCGHLGCRSRRFDCLLLVFFRR